MNTALRFFFLGLFSLLFHQSSSAESIEVSGVVSGTWAVDTVKVVGDIQVREGQSLTIAPGTLVLFYGSCFLDVEGNMDAQGLESEPIYFSMADTTGFSVDTIPDGGWKNIRIEDLDPANDTVRFSYCIFEYGKAMAADSVHGYGGALCVRNTDKVAVEHCLFKDNYAFYNGGAVYLENASIQISDNHFEGNRCGQLFDFFGYGGAICSDWSSPHIYKNLFTQNSSTGIGGAVCVRFVDCPLSHNIFDNNYSALGGGFAILHVHICRYAISNNLFSQNGALYFGAAISNGNSSPLYVNNTIADNHCDGGGGGFYCKDSVVPVLHNNIIYGNTQFGGQSNQVYLWDLLSQPNFYYNNIEGGSAAFYGTGGSAFSGDYENNLDADPMFEPDLFSIKTESPCINTGNPDTLGLWVPSLDLEGNMRIVGSAIDMGAYENQFPVNISETSVPSFELLKIFPNPASDWVQIIINLPENSFIKLSICDASGAAIHCLYEGFANEGESSYRWDFANSVLDGGLYFIHLETETDTVMQKILLVSQ